MAQATDKVIERIKKLLALAGSANENEAAVAAMKAAALLAEHNLSEADIGGIDHEDMMLDGELLSDSRPWRRNMAAAVARLYFCDYFYGFVKETRLSRECGYKRYDRHSFAGRRHNVIVAKAIFTYLCDTIDRLAVKAASAHGPKGKVSFMTSFRHACANRLVERLHEKWLQVSTPSPALETVANTLPALYNEEADKVQAFMDEKVGKTQLVEYNPKLHSLEGAIHGRRAGNDIGLDVQLEPNAASAFMLPSMNKGEG